MPAVHLREVRDDDVALFLRHHTDPVAQAMAGTAARDPEAFLQHFASLRTDPAIFLRTVVADGQVVGHVGSFLRDGQREVLWWLDQAAWGRGIARKAAHLLVDLLPERPLYARIVQHNVGSLKVALACGFEVIGEGRFTNRAGTEHAEFVLVLR